MLYAAISTIDAVTRIKKELETVRILRSLFAAYVSTNTQISNEIPSISAFKLELAVVNTSTCIGTQVHVLAIYRIVVNDKVHAAPHKDFGHPFPIRYTKYFDELIIGKLLQNDYC